MKSEEEIRYALNEFYDKKSVLHPSLITFAEWVLDEGDTSGTDLFLQMLRFINLNPKLETEEEILEYIKKCRDKKYKWVDILAKLKQLQKDGHLKSERNFQDMNIGHLSKLYSRNGY